MYATIWRALPAVFDSLEVPVSRIDPVEHVFGNEGVRIRKRIGGEAISRYFDCGTTQIGPNADSYDVMLILLTTLRAGPAVWPICGTPVIVGKEECTGPHPGHGPLASACGPPDECQSWRPAPCARPSPSRC